jgi:hypothetical protein
MFPNVPVAGGTKTDLPFKLTKHPAAAKFAGLGAAAWQEAKKAADCAAGRLTVPAGDT